MAIVTVIKRKKSDTEEAGEVTMITTHHSVANSVPKTLSGMTGLNEVADSIIATATHRLRLVEGDGSEDTLWGVLNLTKSALPYPLLGTLEQVTQQFFNEYEENDELVFEYYI
ncbi:MAG: hypothetical protein OEX81_03890 [Candidatus Pacebacteria bacterium]|nr:hypothetical protein [Candidatus Paceibacterota bacterium]